MWRSVVVLLLACANPAWALAKPDYALGLALEAREQREVNPDTNGARGIGQLYGLVRLRPAAVEIETSQDSSQTNSGSLSVKSQSTMLGVWGRYEYLHPVDYNLFA